MRRLLCFAGLLALLSCQPPATPPCATTCGGCCDAAGQCQGGQTSFACGTLGASCTACGASEFCRAGVCSLSTGAGGGSTTGGGSATGGGTETGGGSQGGGTSSDSGIDGGNDAGTGGGSADAGALQFTISATNTRYATSIGTTQPASGKWFLSASVQISNAAGAPMLPITASGFGATLRQGLLVPANSNLSSCAFGSQLLAGASTTCTLVWEFVTTGRADSLEYRVGSAFASTPVSPSCPTGQHWCSDVCVLNTSVATCGSNCTACTAPDSGTATCNNGQCDFTCGSGQRPCGASCATCPTTPGISGTSCSGASCVIAGCLAGFVLDGGLCEALWPTIEMAEAASPLATLVTPGGDRYVATTTFVGTAGGTAPRFFKNGTAISVTTDEPASLSLTTDGGTLLLSRYGSAARVTVGGISENITGSYLETPLSAGMTADGVIRATTSVYVWARTTGWASQTLSPSQFSGAVSLVDARITQQGRLAVITRDGAGSERLSWESDGGFIAPSTQTGLGRNSRNWFIAPWPTERIGWAAPGSTNTSIAVAAFGPDGFAVNQTLTTISPVSVVAGIIDTTDQLHVAWLNTTGGVFYSRYTGTSWVTEKVVQEVAADQVSIGIDAAGHPTIFWNGATVARSYKLKQATRR